MQITHFTRFKGYDYSRGAAMFLSFTLEPRLPLLGCVTPEGEMRLSDAGHALDETICLEAQRGAGIVLKRYCIMPDHLHLRVHITPGLPEPLRGLGGFVNNIKRWSRWKAAKLGLAFSWQQNYHDRICMSREAIDIVDAYISQNPLKWALMHGSDPPMRVYEPIISPLLPDGEWWCGVGNVALLDGHTPIMAIQLSRSLALADAPLIIPPLLERCRRAVPASTFISPMERELLNAITSAGLPVIRGVPDPLSMVYRPSVDEVPLFAEKRLLLLSCVDTRENREVAWHGINRYLERLAMRSGGDSIYLKTR